MISTIPGYPQIMPGGMPGLQPNQQQIELGRPSGSQDQIMDIVEFSPEAMQIMSGEPFSPMMEALPLTYMDTTACVSCSQPPQLSSQQQERVDGLVKELDSIFGAPKTLSDAEKEQEKSLIGEINKLTGNAEPKALSSEDERKLQAIHKQIDGIFADGKVTREEEEKLAALDKRIGKLLGTQQQPKELSEADQKKLEGLFTKLDELYGIKAPSEKDLARAEEIFAELDRIEGLANQGSARAVFDPLDMLSDKDRAKAEKLLNELDGIFGENKEPKQLSAADQKTAGKINKRIDELLNVKHPGGVQFKKAGEIIAKINALFEDGVLTAKEEKSLANLESKLEDIFGDDEKSLTKSARKELKGLYAQLDKLYGLKTPSQKEMARADAIHKELAALFEDGNKTA